MKTGEIELAVANWFNYRRNVIIPNVSWGWNIHECDLLVITKSKRVYEVEIKISAADLRADLKKRHQHKDVYNRISRLYFAIPAKLARYHYLIPERAGILTVNSNGDVFQFAKPKINRGRQSISDDSLFSLARLGVLRFWALREKKVRGLS